MSWELGRRGILTVLSEWSYNDSGQLDGEGINYREQGGIQSKTNYVNGIRADGYSYVNYGHTGNLDFEFWHKDGKLIEQKSYDDAGGLIRHEKFSDELQQLVEIPISIQSRYSHHRQYESIENSFWGPKQILQAVLVVILIIMLIVRCPF